MLRDNLMRHEPGDGFRWRSREITRVEGFSDACFGFAVTLLIVSLEVPRTSTELLATMRGFGSFVVTFFMLASLWYAQFTFHRRYGLEDKMTVILNLALLFMVLFFVYPLKFLFGVLLGDPRMHQTMMTAHGMERVVLPEHKPLIFGIFGAGFAGVMLVQLLLYRHAWTLRDVLGLDEFERFETRHAIRRLTAATAVGLSYFGVAVGESLPSHTPSEKRFAVIFAYSILAILVVLMVWMARLIKERRRVKAEWKAKRERTPVLEHPESVGEGE
jgi:Endosomal/lysosomal potassium channel TMEM175